MNKIFFNFLLSVGIVLSQSQVTSAEFWNKYTQEEKIAFINGSYGAVAKLKAHHKAEVHKQFLHDDNWIEPYYIERYYEIADENFQWFATTSSYEQYDYSFLGQYLLFLTNQ